MNLRTSAIALAVGLSTVCMIGQAQASLIGQQVTGVLTIDGVTTTNWFDAANGNVPTGFGNSVSGATTVAIADPAIEFGYNGPTTTASDHSRLRVDFTGSQLNISDYGPFGGTSRDIVVTLTSATPGLFQSIAENSSGVSAFGGIVPRTFSLSGDTFTFSFTENFIGTATDSFDVTMGSTTPPTGVPEPGTAALFGTALVAAWAIRRRKAARF